MHAAKPGRKRSRKQHGLRIWRLSEKKRRRIEAAERADVWEPETADADANQIEEDSDSNAELELPTEQAGAASVRARRAG